MTEDEVKTKWCPYANRTTAKLSSYSVTLPSKEDIHMDLRAYSTCLASECMAWRWSDMLGRRNVETGVIESVADAKPGDTISGRGAGVGYTLGYEKSKVYGYCGMAVKP